MSDRIFAVIWLVLCCAGLVVGWGIHSEYSYEPVGPRPFPLIILGLMTICSVLMLVRKPDAVQWPNGPTLRRLVIMVVLLALYAAFFETLGFPLSSALLAFGMGLLFGAPWWVSALAGISMGPILFYAFDRLLEVTLPVGSWLS